MDWTSENLKLLRYHLQQTQLAFATRLGLRRLLEVHARRKPDDTLAVPLGCARVRSPRLPGSIVAIDVPQVAMDVNVWMEQAGFRRVTNHAASRMRGQSPRPWLVDGIPR